MEAITTIISFAFAIWAISHICQKKQGVFSKIVKSLFSFIYFVVAGAVSGISECLPISIIMFLIGWGVIHYANRLYNKRMAPNEDLFREHKEALRAYEIEKSIMDYEVDEDEELSLSNLQPKKRKVALRKKLVPQHNFQILSQIAFLYINAKGERKFRDVDVVKYDGYYLKGYCHLAREMRTFILDRIEGDVIIRETGEAVDPYEWADMIEFA